MHALRNAGLVATLILTLSACGGGSGGGSNVNPGEAACPGVGCGPDDDREPTTLPEPTAQPEPTTAPPAPLTCGGIAGATCPSGYRCIDDDDNCDPATGADCGGICLLGEDDPGCGGLNGGYCPEGYSCSDPNDGCRGGPEIDCPGICTPNTTAKCDDDSDCPQIDARCSVCADGSVSCPRTGCNDGECTIDVGACAPPVCEGIAGFVCPEGLTCIDDPADDCDPNNGGADCGGICVRVEQPPGCGGGEPCPPGTKCVYDPLAGCWPNAAGDDCGPSCMPVSTEECNDDSDCPQLRAPCSECRDGTAACPQSFCDHGRCNVSFPTCPPPVVCATEDGQTCKPGQVCIEDPNDACDPAIGDVRCGGVCVDANPPRACGGFAGETCPRGYRCVDDPDDDCNADNGGADCPGICQPDDSVECRADDDCPHVQAPCVECPGGSFACPVGLCRNGKCDAAFASCPDPNFCGGIAGFPCPPGFTCIDAPNDECDPENGGADCGGVCVREHKPRPCNGFAGEGCPPGYDCADDSGDDCDPENGGADCPGHCVPAPPPPCGSDAECPQIGAPCRVCPDGTAACPSSVCTNGACQVNFDACEIPD